MIPAAITGTRSRRLGRVEGYAWLALLAAAQPARAGSGVRAIADSSRIQSWRPSTEA